jgi:hypothetical protein
MQALLLVAEHDGPTMFARIGVTPVKSRKLASGGWLNHGVGLGFAGRHSDRAHGRAVPILLARNFGRDNLT